MPIGVAVNSGLAYVGNVGSQDVVNTAARLASSAAAGEVLLSETIHAALGETYADLDKRTLALRGKAAPVTVRAARPCPPPASSA